MARLEAPGWRRTPHSKVEGWCVQGKGVLPHRRTCHRFSCKRSYLEPTAIGNHRSLRYCRTKQNMVTVFLTFCVRAPSTVNGRKCRFLLSSAQVGRCMALSPGGEVCCSQPRWGGVWLSAQVVGRCVGGHQPRCVGRCMAPGCARHAVSHYKSQRLLG